MLPPYDEEFREVAMDQGGEQTMGARDREAERLGRIGQPDRSLLLEQGGESQGPVDRLDRIDGTILHSRKP